MVKGSLSLLMLLLLLRTIPYPTDDKPAVKLALPLSAAAEDDPLLIDSRNKLSVVLG